MRTFHAASLLVAALGLSAGCFASHARDERPDPARADTGLAPLDDDAGVDAGPPRSPSACAVGPVPIIDVGGAYLGNATVVSRGPDYAVGWTHPGGPQGLVIVKRDGRLVPAGPDAAVRAIALDDGYLLAPHYGHTFWRATVDGASIGEPLVLPDSAPPHWQFFEAHEGVMGLVGHSPFDAAPVVYRIDLEAWSFTRDPSASPSRSYLWGFSGREALTYYRPVTGPPGAWLRSRRLLPGGAVVFDVRFSELDPRVIRFDGETDTWLLAGARISDGSIRRAALARVSASGEVLDLATLPDDALAADLLRTDGVRAAVAASPTGAAVALRPAYQGQERMTGLTVAFHAPGSDTLVPYETLLGAPTAWSPTIAWSDADAGFAVVTVERNAEGGGVLSLRCGLRP